MKRTLIITSAGLAAAILLSVNPALLAADRRAPKERQVSGQVLSVKRIASRDKKVNNLFAMIRTKRGGKNLLVDLGAGRGLNVQQGETIAVQGPIARLRNQPVLVASRVKDDGRVTDIRRP